MLQPTQPASTNKPVVLIDDDMLVHMVWKTMAPDSGQNLRCFYNADEFFEVSAQVDKDAQIYIDCHLGNDVRGEEIARKVHDAGFNQIYLATGYEADSLEKPDCVLGVVGKEPPWVCAGNGTDSHV